MTLHGAWHGIFRVAGTTWYFLEMHGWPDMVVLRPWNDLLHSDAFRAALLADMDHIF